MRIKHPWHSAIPKLVFSSVLILTAANSFAAPVEPNAGKWKTWVISSGSQSRLPPPPGSNDTQKELRSLRQQIANRTSADLEVIHYWDTGAPGYRWFQIARDVLSKHGASPPATTRALALLGAAIYDTIVAAWDSKFAYNRLRPSMKDPTIGLAADDVDVPSYPSEHAATAAAAAAVLGYLYPDEADHMNLLATQAENSRVLAGASYPSDVKAGEGLGNSVGLQVVNYGKKDGSDAVFAGSFPPAPGRWSGTNPTAPLAGQWKTWVVSSGQEYRAPPPPAFGSEEAARQIAMVKAVVRTPAVLDLVWFWQPTFVYPWLDILNTKIFEYDLGGNAPRAARAYALEAIAMHDSIVTRFESAYAYMVMRPPQADPTITAVYALPVNPSYPAAHASASGGVEAVLSYLFPADAKFFHDKALEATQATFNAAVHFQIDEDVGLTQGHMVAAKVIERASQDGSN